MPAGVQATKAADEPGPRITITCLAPTAVSLALNADDGVERPRGLSGPRGGAGPDSLYGGGTLARFLLFKDFANRQCMHEAAPSQGQQTARYVI